MEELKFSNDAKETMDKFFAIWPIATKNIYEKKAIKALECHLLKKGLEEITKSILLEVLLETFPTYESSIMGLKDPKLFMEKFNAQKINATFRFYLFSVVHRPE